MFELIIIGFYLFIASYFDFKSREVPDILSYTFIASGLVFNAILSIIFWDYSYILFSVLGFLVFWGLSLLLYYAGQWGGGDAKLLMGIGGWYGLQFVAFPKIGLFFINLLVFGAIYGLVYGFVLVIINIKKILKFIQDKSDIKKQRFWVRIIAIAIFSTIFLVKERQLQIIILLLDFLLFFGYYSIVFIKALEKTVLLKKIPISKLTEGDWVTDEIKVKGKTIFKPKKTGITFDDIKLFKKYKIKKTLVREGIPFIPSFFIAFIATELTKPWLLAMLNSFFR